MIDLVTPEEAKLEAAKGLKEAIAVSLKKFECFLSVTCKDIRADELTGKLSSDTCGMCIYHGWTSSGNFPDCDECGLCIGEVDCYMRKSLFQQVIDRRDEIHEGHANTITAFRKETRKMIKILKQLLKENS